MNTAEAGVIQKVEINVTRITQTPEEIFVDALDQGREACVCREIEARGSGYDRFECCSLLNPPSLIISCSQQSADIINVVCGRLVRSWSA